MHCCIYAFAVGTWLTTTKNAMRVSRKGGAMPLSIRLPEDAEARVSHLAALTGRTKPFLVIEAVREHIDDLEDLYLAEQRLSGIRAGKTQTVSLEEVIKRYGLES
jgi:RHH-type rel operon transcriptional repressor/antitoxin RelB